MILSRCHIDDIGHQEQWQETQTIRHAWNVEISASRKTKIHSSSPKEFTNYHLVNVACQRTKILQKVLKYYVIENTYGMDFSEAQ